MARSFTPNEASEIARWHMGLLSRLKSATSSPSDTYLSEIRFTFNNMSTGGYFERSYRKEVEDGVDPLSDIGGLSRLVTSIYRYKRFSELTSQCSSLLKSHENEIDHLLEELEPAFKGFTWNFLPARTKIAAESACSRLIELKESQYPALASSALDELDSLSGISSDLAWSDFLEDRVGYRRIVVECSGKPLVNGSMARCADELIMKAEGIGKCASNVKSAPLVAASRVKKASEGMLQLLSLIHI